MKQVKLVVSGRVQGVSFRASTKRKAVSLGLRGFVRNLGNGDVEVLAQGDEKELDELIKFCSKGPLLSRVDNLDASYGCIKKEFKEFEIRY